MSLFSTYQTIQQQLGFVEWEDVLKQAEVCIPSTPEYLKGKKSCPVHKILYNLAPADGDDTARLLLSSFNFTELEMDKILEALKDIMQKAPLENRKKLVETFPAPSKFGGSSFWKTGSRHAYAVSNHRHCNAVIIPHSVPVSLLCKEFGEFQDILRDSQPCEFVECVPLALKLMCQMSHVYETEADRVKVLTTILEERFCCRVIEGTQEGAKFRTDLSLVDKGGKVHCNVKIKNELGGTKKSPTLQQVGYAFALNNTDKKFGPLLLISLAGPEYFQVYGAAWYSDRMCIDQLTDPMSLLEEPHNQDASAEKLARVLFTIEVTIRKLSNLEVTDFLYPYYHYTNSQSIGLTHPLRGNVCLWKASMNSERQIVVKFVHHYGLDVHKYLASEDMAPSVLHTEFLPGGWMVVVMDYVDGESPVSLQTDSDKIKFDEFMNKLKGALRRKNFVHGDLRSPNIIKCEDKFMVVDFDWAGKNGEVKYPVTINMDQFRWHRGVKPCYPILHEHDEFQLDKILVL